METPPAPDEFKRVLREIDEIVDEAARLQQALDAARHSELARRHFPDQRQGERRQAADRRATDRRRQAGE